MNIVNFTPISAFLGGSLIGLAVVIFFVFNGRLIGISGIASNFLTSKDNRFDNFLFLIGLIILVLLFASNLWGFFELRLPNALSQVGANGHNTNHLSSHFMQGAFVTLLATPCSAPFLGTAVGFALARGTAEIFAIFLALGVGLALPFLILSLIHISEPTRPY